MTFKPDPKPKKREKKERKPLKRTPLKRVGLVKKRKEVVRTCKLRGCSNKFTKWNDDLVTDWCSVEHAIALSKQRIADKEAKERKADRKRIKEEKVKNRTVAEWKAELQKVVNWIVLHGLDMNYGCISHPKMPVFNWNAGHYYSIGTCSDVRFNFHNIHKQGNNANREHGGGPDYISGLNERYGREYVDMILGFRREWKGIGKRCFTIPNIRDTYLPSARKIKSDIKKGSFYTRDQLNEMIGIYINENKKIN